MTEDIHLHRLYARARLDDREVNELIGLTHDIIADGMVMKDEVDYLYKWLVAHTAATANPAIAKLLGRVDAFLADDVVDPEDAADLFSVLSLSCSASPLAISGLVERSRPPPCR
jgi:hypothetical protein